MAASDVRSSARVSPRSVIRVAWISPITVAHVARLGAHGAGDRHVAHGAVAHGGGERLGGRRDVLRDGVEHPVVLEHLALVGEVDRRQLELLLLDVVPDVELGPVGEREHADVLAAPDPPVVEVPELGALRARVPLAEVVAEGEDALLRAGALLVAAGAAERGVEAALLDRVEQRLRLQPVARRADLVLVPLLADAAGVDRVLDPGGDQALAELADAALDVLHDLREVVAGVHVEDREREPAGAERLLGEPQQDDRVLAAAEHQDGALELRRDLAEDVHGFGLERAQVVGGAHRTPCRGRIARPVIWGRPRPRG